MEFIIPDCRICRTGTQFSIAVQLTYIGQSAIFLYFRVILDFYGLCLFQSKCRERKLERILCLIRHFDIQTASIFFGYFNFQILICVIGRKSTCKLMSSVKRIGIGNFAILVSSFWNRKGCFPGNVFSIFCRFHCSSSLRHFSGSITGTWL